MDWYRKTPAEVLVILGSGERGLSEEAARRRLIEAGPNLLPAPRPETALKIFFKQFQSPLIFVLLVAAGIVFLLGELVDALVIMSVLAINAAIGAVQEGRAQNTLSALRRFLETETAVLREGREVVIADRDLVAGDVFLLKEGDRVPADGRLIHVNTLKVDESALTGESESVLKTADVLRGENLPLAEQRNMVFAGTYILYGAGRAVAAATGRQTVIGKFSARFGEIESEVPLKASIRFLSRAIIVIVLSVSALLFAGGVTTGRPADEMFAVAVAIAVSAIPEGLPVVVTLILATGVWRMGKRQVLVKRLQAVEALGQAQVIALDKTGTITANQMMVARVFVDGKTFEVSGRGYEPQGEFTLAGQAVERLNHPEILLCGKIAAFTAGAATAYFESQKEWRRLSGDPTEAALLVFAQKLGFNQGDLLRENPVLTEKPFDVSRPYHFTVSQSADGRFLAAAGAPEPLFQMSRYFWREGKSFRLDKDARAEWERRVRQLSANGFRVLALAADFAPPTGVGADSELSLCLVGLVGIHDVVRPEVGQAVAEVVGAGLRLVMITGDHLETARAIARETKIWRPGDEVMTGAELEKLNIDVLAARLPKISVFARVTPEHKLKIIEAFRHRREITAMTGDGVNDTLSLAAADLGVAMGKIGTEVAKEAADLVLLDDNFGSIVAAVEEGRNIYRLIQKVVLYLFSTSLGEILVISLAILAGYPLPLFASQIIWLNLVTDGFIVVALAMEPRSEKLLRGRFAVPRRWMVDGAMLRRILLMATVMTIGSFWVFVRFLEIEPAKATTVALTVMAVYQWFNGWNCRSASSSVFSRRWLGNRFLVVGTVLAVGLQLAAVYLPFFQRVLRTVALGWREWLVIIAVAFSIILAEELRKSWGRFRRRRREL